MRALWVCCLVAACGNDPGMELVVKGASKDVVSVEVFLPDDVDDSSSIGMPPQRSAPLDGAVYSVVDSVKTTVSGDTRILLQPGDIHDVPGLLVLAYDGNGTPIAKTVVRNADGSWLHLPSTNTTVVEITLEPAMYVAPSSVPQTSGSRISRWSQSGAPGDLQGGCIAVLGPDGNSFFDTKDDLDCDNKKPECDDRVWNFVDTSSTPPPTGACASNDFKMPDTGDACRIGQTIACADGYGTCGPIATGTSLPPICVPEALCKSCPNSDSTSGTSGIDPSCEADAKMNGDDVPVVDCDIEAMVTAEGIQPCQDTLPPLNFSMDVGAGWGCAHTAGFVGQFGVLSQTGNMPGDLAIGSDPATGYALTASCNQTVNLPVVTFTMRPNNMTPMAIAADTTADAMLVLGVRPNITSPLSAELALPFHLHFHQVQQCMQNVTASCTIKTLHDGDYKNDAMWSGCAGAM